MPLPALAGALPFLSRHWKALGAALVLFGLLAALWITRATLERRTEALEAEKAARIELVAKYHAAAELAQSQAEAHKAAVERDQTQISLETARDYQTDLAALHARYDRLRQQARANQGVPGQASGSSLPNTSSGTDEAAPTAELHSITITPEQALTAEEIRLQLIALQGWVTKQAAIER